MEALTVIVALIGAARAITPEIEDLLVAWGASEKLTQDDLLKIDAALNAKRAEVAAVFKANGVN